MFRYFTLDNFEFKDKVVGVRVDINSPMKNGKIILNERIIKSAITIKELSKKGAKIVILAHQGRKDQPDCISLEEHAKLLSKQIGVKIKFVSVIYSKVVEDTIKTLKAGEILMVENLRFYSAEKNPELKDNLILKLEKYFNYYVFDAFSVAHRKQTSVVGFKSIPNIAGRIMEGELKGLSNIESVKKPRTFIFGGAKPDDLVVLMESALKKKKVENIILTGVIGEIALYLKGYYLGSKYEFLKKKNYLNSIEKIETLLKKYSEQIILPTDLAIKVNGKRVEIEINKLSDNKKLLDKYLIQDIGLSSIKYFSKIINSSSSIYFKGPPGNFEEKGFEIGTKLLVKEIVKSKAFTYLGGGHSVTAAQIYGVLNKISYVSLAGGALVKFLSGEKLVGIESLENSFKKFEPQFEDFVVIGSNTIDTYICANESFYDMKIGDKVKVKNNFETQIGGGGINCSIAFARLGAKVGYLGKISFESEDKIKEVLKKNKINLIPSKITSRLCAKSVILDTKDDDRVIYTYRGQNKYFSLNDFDLSCFRAKNYYFNSLTHEGFETLVKLSTIIKKRNPTAKICYNPSSYLIRKHQKKVKKLIKNCEVLVLNYQEASMLTNKVLISQCLKSIFKMGVEIIVITDGANGTYCYDGKSEFFQKAIFSKKIIDTTGAGDSFASTFFYFYVKNYGIKKSMFYAAKNATAVISKKGPSNGLLNYENLIKK